MLLGAFVSPCGALSMAPEHKDPGEIDRSIAEKLLESRLAIGQQIDSLKPAVIVLLSVHELADPSTRFNIFLNSSAVAETNYMAGCDCSACTTRLTVKLDDEFAGEMLRHLQAAGENVEGVKFTNGREDGPAKMRWSSAIPLTQFQHLDRHKFVVVSMPQFLMYKKEYKQRCERFGQNLAEFLKDCGKDVVIMVCGDLHHGYSADGPYGLIDIAEKFDSLCGKWAGQLDKSALDEAATMWPGKGRSCGFGAFVVMDSTLRRAAGGKPVESVWQPKLHVIGHPSYFGMMVASMVRKN